MFKRPHIDSEFFKRPPDVIDPEFNLSLKTKRTDELRDLLQTCDSKTRARKKLRPQGSFSSEYWSQASSLAVNSYNRTLIKRELDLREAITEEATPAWFTQHMKALETESRLYKKQAERLETEPGDTAKTCSRAWMLMFTASQCGLQIKSGIGERDSGEQSKFWQDLKISYNAENSEGAIWDPILADWFPAEHCRASHIFSYRHGQEVMTALFGSEVEGELFSPRNGLMLHDCVEARFDAGLFVIVPDVQDIRDAMEMSRWNDARQKDWKIKILDWNWPKIDHTIHRRPGLKWRDLDGRKLQFRNAFRPRARFLYFNYCVQILRYAWSHPSQSPPLKDELGKPFWGTIGKYVHRNFIRGMVDECGHEYYHLFEDGIKSRELAGREDVIEREVGLALACNWIKGSGENKEITNDEDSDEEENEDIISLQL
ncbi:hypothetical protein V8E54_002001 [Elaphomyces granulatus]